MNGGTASALLPVLLGVGAGAAVIGTGGLASTALLAGSAALAVGSTGTQIYAANEAQSQASKVAQAQTDQAAVQAGEQQQSIKTQLEIDNTAAAQRAARIREELLGVLGEQDATLAARGVSIGSGAPGALEAETRRRFEDDLSVNRLNEVQAAADAAANSARVNSWLKGTQENARLGYSGASKDIEYRRTAAILGGATQLADLGGTYFANRQRPFLGSGNTYTPRYVGGRAVGPGGTIGGRV